MSGELLSRRPVDAVTEREIDLLLLMALHCSLGFRAFLASKIGGPGDCEFLGAWRGIFDNLGECDLLVHRFRETNRVPRIHFYRHGL